MQICNSQFRREREKRESDLSRKATARATRQPCLMSDNEDRTNIQRGYTLDLGYYSNIFCILASKDYKKKIFEIKPLKKQDDLSGLTSFTSQHCGALSVLHKTQT